MSNVVIKYRRKPTPIKTAVLWISLTTNCFLAAMGYLVVIGKIERHQPDFIEAAQQVQEELPSKPVHLSRR